jgi:leucine dehydrogenase
MARGFGYEPTNFLEEDFMTDNIQEIKVEGYQKILKAELLPGVFSIISVHNTALGPALGGCRLFPYASHEEALTDVLRLSEGMSYKSAMANLKLGGGKSIIIGDPGLIKSKELFQAFGKFVDSFGGNYITAKDVNISLEDLNVIAGETASVRGTSLKGSSGDPSPMTAFGVYQGMKASAKFLWGSDDLKGKKIVVQGLGSVGLDIVSRLVKDGAEVFACELSQKVLDKAVQDYGIHALELDGWMRQEADIFCPCAMGGVIDKKSITKLKENGIQIVAGAANNQLLDVVEDSKRLRKAGILFAPDYIINAGGVINVYCEGEDGGYEQDKALALTTQIFDTMIQIFERAKREDRGPALVSLDMAKEKIGLKVSEAA